MLDQNKKQDDGMPMPERVDALMKGSIDLHVHSGPSVMARRLDHIDELKEASAAGQKAMLIKDHYFSGAPIVNVFEPYLEG